MGFKLPDDPKGLIEYIFSAKENDPEIKEEILPVLSKNGISTTYGITRLVMVCIELYKRVIELEKKVANGQDKSISK